MASADESALIKALQAGVPDAQERFWNLHYDPLIGWVWLRGIRPKEDVEEVVRDAFLRAYLGIGKFRGESLLKTWLFELANHALIDYRRSPKHTSIQTPTEPAFLDDTWAPETGSYRAGQNDKLPNEKRSAILNPVSPALEDLIKVEHRQQLHQILEQLSEDHRTVIYLRRIEAFSVAETAKVMGRSGDAIKMLTLRAFEALQVLAAKDPYFNDGEPSKEGASND